MAIRKGRLCGAIEKVVRVKLFCRFKTFEVCHFIAGMWKRKRLIFCRSGSALKKLEAEATSEAFDFLRSRSGSVFHKTWGWDAEMVEAVKFLWKRKHFEKRSWKRKQI